VVVVGMRGGACGWLVWIQMERKQYVTNKITNLAWSCFTYRGRKVCRRLAFERWNVHIAQLKSP
jgi:hypothetical protein